MALLGNEHISLKPVIAIIGNDASKQIITAYLKHQCVPQLNVISCLDADEFASCLAPPITVTNESKVSAQQNRKGILRADWLEKHQTRRPAVALVLVPRHCATGDPSSWAELVSSLDGVRALTKPTKIRVVIAVVQPPGDTSPLPDDRTSMLARHSGADRGCVITYQGFSGDTNNDAEMRSLGSFLQAQATLFYSTNAQSRLNSYSQNGLASVDANLRAAFKLGALAELRGAWAEAVQLYREAYGYVGQVSMAGAAPLQRFLEVRTVAELVHHRLLSLLVGALRDASGATAQLSTHLDMLRTVPIPSSTAPASLLANHSGWLAQQFTTAAELVTSSGLLALPVSFPPSLRPAHLYVEAAKAAALRRSIVHVKLIGMSSSKEESVSSGRYLGQIEIPSGNSNPRDDQVERWLQIKEIEAFTDLQNDNTTPSCSTNKKNTCLYLLTAAKTAALTPLSSSTTAMPCSKLLASIDSLLGEELLYFSIDIPAAKQALCAAAEQYRKDRWYGPLYRVLMALRECAEKEGEVADHVALSLEASAVSLDLLNTNSSSTSSNTSVDVDSMAQAAVEELTTQLNQHDIEFLVEQGGGASSPWANTFKLSSAGFLNKNKLLQLTATGGGGDDSVHNVLFQVQVQNATPVDINFLAGRVVFKDWHGCFEVEAIETNSSTMGSGTSGTVGLEAITRENVPPGISAKDKSSSTTKAQKKALTTVNFVCRLSSRGRKPSPWIEASKFILHLSEKVSITYLLPATTTLPTIEGGSRSLRVELPTRHCAPELALLVPEQAFIGEYLPAKVRIFSTQNVASTPSDTAAAAVFKSCRVVVTAEVTGTPVAILFKKSESQILQKQLEFDETGINDGDGGSVVDFGFAVQAPVEETINFSAHLYYTTTLEEEEGSLVHVHATVTVLLPFECDVSVAASMAMSPETTSSSSTVNNNANAISAGPVFTLASSSVSPSAVLVEDVLTSSLKSLSVQDAQLRRALAPRLPTHFLLPTQYSNGKQTPQSQWCAEVNLRKLRPAGREWRNSVALEALTITALSIENSEKIKTAEEGNGGGSALVDIAPLIIFEQDTQNLAELKNHGDTCSAAFQINTSKPKPKQQQHQDNNATSSIPSLGTLLVRWRRSSTAAIKLIATSSTSTAAPTTSKIEEENDDVYIGTIENLQNGQVSISLPPFIFNSPVLTAQPFFPSHATAGEPIRLEIEIHSRAEEVEVVVGDPRGFLIAGPRATTVLMKKKGSSGGGEGGANLSESCCSSRWVEFCLVSYHVGYLELPEFKVSVYGQGELQATEGCIVYVKPAALEDDDGGAAVVSE